MGNDKAPPANLRPWNPKLIHSTRPSVEEVLRDLEQWKKECGGTWKGLADVTLIPPAQLSRWRGGNARRPSRLRWEQLNALMAYREENRMLRIEVERLKQRLNEPENPARARAIRAKETDLERRRRLVIPERTVRESPFARGGRLIPLE